MSESLKEYRDFILTHLRELEVRQAGTDSERVRQAESVSDDDLLKKWLWIGTIGGGIICFLIFPVFYFLAGLIPIFIMEVLWVAHRFAMGLVLIIFGFAIYVTVKKQSE